MNSKSELFQTHKPILIIKQRGIGDVILSIPTVRTIRKYFKNAPISLVLDSPSVPLFETDPDIDEVIEITNGYGGILRAIGRIRNRFAIVFDLISTPFSLFMSLISGAQLRVGWSTPRRKRGRGYTHPVDTSISIPANKANLRAVERLGMVPITEKPRLSISKEEIDRTKKEHFNSLNLDINKLTIALHPGALFETKQWFPDRFARLADMITDQDIQVVLTGSEREQEVVGKVKSLSNNNLFHLPPIPLRDFARFLASMDLFITNDGGPLHLAQSVGTKTVAIFGSTDPAIWFPYRIGKEGTYVYSNLCCSPCAKKRCKALECLSKIDADDVFSRVMSSLGDGDVSRETV